MTLNTIQGEDLSITGSNWGVNLVSINVSENILETRTAPTQPGPIVRSGWSCVRVAVRTQYVELMDTPWIEQVARESLIAERVDCVVRQRVARGRCGCLVAAIPHTAHVRCEGRVGGTRRAACILAASWFVRYLCAHTMLNWCKGCVYKTSTGVYWTRNWWSIFHFVFIHYF